MKRVVLVFLGLLAAVATADAGWQDELTPPQPGPLPVLQPLKAHYRFGWTAFTAAEAEFDFSKMKGGMTRLSVSAKTIGFPRTLWRMDAVHTATMQTASLRPISVRQTETYAGEVRKTKLDFNAEGVSRLRETVPPDPRPPKTKRFKYPAVFDLHSALHFVRSQPLNPGDVVKLVVYPTSSPYLAHVAVMGRQKTQAAGKSYGALKLDLKLWEIDDDDLKLKTHRGFKRASAWISDDADRLLLRIEGEIFVGSVWAELDRVEFRGR
jgi:hypothetical protein